MKKDSSKDAYRYRRKSDLGKVESSLQDSLFKPAQSRTNSVTDDCNLNETKDLG